MPKYLPALKALILDMDGVLWRGDQPLGDLSMIFSEFSLRGYRIAVATNNATLSDTQYLNKLKGFGVSLEPWQVISSPDIAAQFLLKKFPRGGAVFIIGEEGMIDTLATYGFYHADHNVLSVVVGLDRSLTYEKIMRATLHIRSGAILLGTNGDRTLPAPEGLIPGAGSILAALEAATDVPPIIVGKPEREMFQYALERLDALPKETLVVGDRLDTDILGGQKVGCYTALLLSGVTLETEAKIWNPVPDIIAPDLTSLLEWLT